MDQRQAARGISGHQGQQLGSDTDARLDRRLDQKGAAALTQLEHRPLWDSRPPRGEVGERLLHRLHRVAHRERPAKVLSRQNEQLHP